MNFELLEQYDITAKDAAEIKEEIETKIMDIDERLDNVDDEDRIAKLENDKKVLNELLIEAKKMMEAPKEEKKEDKSANLVPVDDEPKKERNIPVAVSDEEKKEKKEKAKPAEDQDKAKDDAKHEEELRKQAAELQKKQQAEKLKQEKQERKENKENEIKEADDAIEKIFQSGLNAMNTRDFKTAFNEFNRILNPDKNANSITGKLSKEHEADAKYLFGKIYFNGLNGNIEIDRGIFWFNEAAKLGQQLANIELGLYHAGKQPADITEKMSNLDNALDYFKAAGDAGNADAMKKYVELCMNSQGVKILLAQKNVALSFCKKLSEIENDSFEKNEMLKKRKEIRKLQIRDKEQVMTLFQRIIYIVACIIEFYGIINLWGALLYTSENNLLKFEIIPKVNNLPSPILTKKIIDLMDIEYLGGYVDESMLLSSIWIIMVSAALSAFFGKGIKKWVSICVESIFFVLIGIGGVLGSILLSNIGMAYHFDPADVCTYLVILIVLIYIYHMIVTGFARKLSGE